MADATPERAVDAVETVPAEVIPPNYRIRLFSLRFEDDCVEQRFIPAHLVRALPIIRIFLLAAAALYATFGILDMYAIPQTLEEAWLIRYAGVCPFLFSVIALTYTPFFLRWSQPLLGAAVFVSGFGIILMTAIAEAPGNAHYYAGLIMVVIYGSSLIRLRCINAAIIALVLFSMYQVVAFWINPIPADLILSNNFFLGMSVAVGIFSSYVQELYVRLDFISTEMLKAEKERTSELLTEAMAASKAKSDFLAIMSHELRTPLNAILGFSEIMQLRMFGPMGSDRYATYVDDIHYTAKHLLNIITDVLDFSKAEVGRLTIKEEDVDLSHTLEQCLRLLREKAAEVGLRMSLEPPRERLLLRIDATLIKQVFINLIGNAIKFTQSGGEVRAFIMQEADGSCCVKITDTGIGIAEDDIEKVLEPFFQVENVFVRKRGGTGLGLPLSKKIMLLHGGTLTIKSALGVGTTVTITFPASCVIYQPMDEAGVA
jgi:two-component system cell cycle sensor histidine kinase PleC